MKRRIAVVLGAAAIAVASPAVAVADTGSASTGSSANVAALFQALPEIWQECGLLVFTGQCGGVVTQPPV